MNPASEKSSRGFWVWGFLFLLLLHAFAIFWFGERRGVVPFAQKPAAFLFLSSDLATDRRLTESIALRDPTLFALPNARGFSGGAWLRLQPATPKLTNWAAPLEWLTWPADQLGNSLSDYLSTNRPSEETLLNSLRVTAPPEVRIPDVPVITHTLVSAQGPLARRKISRTPVLPSASGTDLLPQTTLAVSVNGDGAVRSAAVIGTSGSEAADDDAIDAAREFEFEPLPIRDARARELAPPTMGRLVFTWHIVLPTNATATTAGLP
jgi:TonB family protein